MKFCLRIFLLLLVVTGTLTDDGFDLGDALGDPDPTPPKPKEQPEDKPKSDGGFDLFEALDPDHQPYTDKPAVVPPKNGGGGADPSDPDLPWGQILKMLNANMPEEFYMWMANLKQLLTPLLERAMDLLQALP